MNYLQILDLTQRLPGPYAGYLLANLGHVVTSDETLCNQDPFLTTPGLRPYWELLKGPKKILSRHEINHQNTPFDVILRSHQNFELPPLSPQLQLVVDIGNQSNMPLHDLNLWRELKFAPTKGGCNPNPIVPLLPFAGLSYGQYLVSFCLSQYYILREKKAKGRVCLSLPFLETFHHLFPFTLTGDEIFSGEYPCYSVYRLLDGSLVAACVEKKFFEKFITILIEGKLLPSGEYHRFEKSHKSEIQKHLQLSTKSSLNALFQDTNICVQIV